METTFQNEILSKQKIINIVEHVEINVDDLQYEISECV